MRSPASHSPSSAEDTLFSLQRAAEQVVRLREECVRRTSSFEALARPHRRAYLSRQAVSLFPLVRTEGDGTRCLYFPGVRVQVNPLSKGRLSAPSREADVNRAFAYLAEHHPSAIRPRAYVLEGSAADRRSLEILEQIPELAPPTFHLQTREVARLLRQGVSVAGAQLVDVDGSVEVQIAVKSRPSPNASRALDAAERLIVEIEADAELDGRVLQKASGQGADVNYARLWCIAEMLVDVDRQDAEVSALRREERTAVALLRKLAGEYVEQVRAGAGFELELVPGVSVRRKRPVGGSLRVTDPRAAFDALAEHGNDLAFWKLTTDCETFDRLQERVRCGAMTSAQAEALSKASAKAGIDSESVRALIEQGVPVPGYALCRDSVGSVTVGAWGIGAEGLQGDDGCGDGQFSSVPHASFDGFGDCGEMAEEDLLSQAA